MLATVDGVTFTYPGAEGPALRGVSLAIDEGTFVLVAGPSGGGKSTLLRLFNGLVPQFSGGTLAGEVCVAGLNPARTPSRVMASVVGMVFQEPEAQAVAPTVEEDVAFGLEEAGWARPAMRERVDQVLDRLGIPHLATRKISTLSGGERQRVAIAAALAPGAGLLVLDEPASQLDGEGADALVELLGEVHRGGTAVVVSEHRLDRLLPAVEVVVAVSEGRACALSPGLASATLEAVPPAAELVRRLGGPGVRTFAEAAAFLEGRRLRSAERFAAAPGGPVVTTRGLTVSYGAGRALDGLDLDLGEGELVALVGPNGSGKTTLLRALAGVGPAPCGDVRFQGRTAPRKVQERSLVAGLVPQDPAMALARERVRDDIDDSLRFRNLDRSGVATVLRDWGLAGLAERHPRDISVGQQQRVALAVMLAHEPKAWLLDEPTRGADGPAKAWLAARLREHSAGGGTALVATHDTEWAATFATRVICLRDGRATFDLPARQAFAAGGPLPTQIARLVPGAVALDEVVL